MHQIYPRQDHFNFKRLTAPLTVSPRDFFFTEHIVKLAKLSFKDERSRDPVTSS